MTQLDFINVYNFRLRVHSEEHNSTNSLDSPCSESPKSWPSSLTTPMNYIKGKKRKHSRFHIPSPLEQSDDVFGGVEEHNLSHQSINSDAVSFLSFNDSAAGMYRNGYSHTYLFHIFFLTSKYFIYKYYS